MSGRVFCDRVSAALKAEATGCESRKVWISEEADDLGFNEETLKSYLHGKTCPGLEALMTMAGRYGAQFLNKILNPSGFHCETLSDMTSLQDGEELRNLRRMEREIRAALGPDKLRIEENMKRMMAGDPT